MAETKVFPDFHRDLTREPDQEPLPEINDDEKARVAKSFNRTLNRWFSHFDSEVEHGQTEFGQTVDRLRKRVEVDDQICDLEALNLGDQPGAATNSKRVFKRVVNLWLMADDQPSHLSSYRLCGDNVVRRYDVDLVIDQIRAKMVDRDLRSAAGPHDLQWRDEEAQRNRQENLKLEEKLGVNNQPVSLKEIDGLGRILGDVGQPRQPEPSPYL